MQISNNTQASLEAMLNALRSVDGDQLASEKVKDVSIVSGADGGITVTFNALVDGTETPMTISLTPELEAPDGVADNEVIGDILAKLEGLNVDEMTPEESAAFMREILTSVAEKIAAKGGLDSAQVPAKNTKGSATLFNLLEVLSLIVEAGQELKKSSRMMRAANNEMQAQAFERQASKTMATASAAKAQTQQYALISMAVMVASALTAVGAGAYGALKGGASETKALGVEANMSKSIFSKESGTLNMDAVTSAAGLKAAAKLDPAVVNSIKNDFAANPAILKAKTDFTTATAEVNTARAELNTAMEANNNNPEAQAVKTAQAKLDTAMAKLDTAKQDFKDAVGTVKSSYDNAYINELDPAAKETAYNKMVVANEFAMKELATGKSAGENGVPILSKQDLGKIAHTAKRNFGISVKAEQHWGVAALATTAAAGGQLAGAMNQMWQSDVNFEAQNGMADAQKEQANATREQNEYDLSKSLEDSGQGLIDALIRTLSKLYESQHQTTREIFS